MKYLEAEEPCKGCAASLAITLINLPQSVPDPNQAAMILCKAKTRPVIIEGNIRYLENGNIEVPFTFDPRFKPCALSPHPNQATCNIFSLGQRLGLKTKNHLILTQTEFDSGIIKPRNIRFGK